MSVPLLAARGLDYRYSGGISALRDLNLTVERGRKLAVLGANGSGKTTLLLHLNGTFRPTRGELRLDGDPVAYDRRSLRPVARSGRFGVARAGRSDFRRDGGAGCLVRTAESGLG